MSDGAFVLPPGTVTLLLSDIEGSTRAWESDAAATGSAVAAVNRLVDELVGRYDGVRPLEQGEGDSFVAAFARARDGVACALALQRALVAGPLRLRLGVHTGDVIRRGEGDYAGPTIIRTARLRNLAHGGQTVLSEATRELVVDALPQGATLRDLGVHRLKDLSRPERMFQLCHPDLRPEFPPLRSLDVRPHNLPIQRTTFIGRTGELAELAELLGRERLVTLTGSGGCGKTRLALQVAAEVIDGFPDGVWFVDLASVGEPDGVAARAAQAVGVLHGPAMTPAEAVVAHLASKTALLVVDNCEQVIDPAAGLVDAVLTGCPGARVLATSREPLQIQGEAAWRVPPLSLPPEDAGPADIEGLGLSEAVQLFIERAALARAGFTLEERHRQPVAEICRRLDGIPLAIELAAARVRVLTPAQIAEGLNRRFQLLTGSSRTAMPRQQTLQASLDWSHALLTEPEQIVFRRLGVFAGSFDLEAATTVTAAADIQTWQVLDVLTLLVDKNLVAVEDSGQVARYRLLETMRHYAQARLDAAGETEGTRTRHRDHYLTLGEDAAPHLETADSPAWFARLDLDYPNLEAALQWSHHHGQYDQLCRMVAAICPAWRSGGLGARSWAQSGLQWIETALSADTLLSPRARGLLLWCGTHLAYALNDRTTAARMVSEGLELAEENDDDLVRGRMLTGVGMALGTSKSSAEVWGKALFSSRRANDEFGLAVCLGFAGLHQADRNPSAARLLAEEAIRLGDAHANRVAGTGGRASLGLLLLNEGRVAEAVEELRTAVQIAMDSGLTLLLLGAQWLWARACALAGESEECAAVADHMAALSESTGVRRDSYLFHSRSLVAALNRDAVAAVEYANRAVASADDMLSRVETLLTAARVHLAVGDGAKAEGFVAVLRDLSAEEDLVFVAVETQLLDARCRRLSRKPDAEEAVQAMLSAAVDLPAWSTVVDALETLGGLAADAQSFEEAGRLFGAAAELREWTGYRLGLSERDADTAKVRDALGDDRFGEVFAQGRSLSAEDAVAYARRGHGERKRPSVGWDSLTPNEAQIVELVRQGMTNAEIGRRMFVSARTVQSHLTHIYTKLGVRSRTELASRSADRHP
jgi:predicted ATPase/class 3 adenylate cyclase/DNA-binding CsgD family transcriptional regulator